MHLRQLFDDVGFLSVPGEHSKNWLMMSFTPLTNATKLALSWDGNYRILNTLKNIKLRMTMTMTVTVTVTVTVIICTPSKGISRAGNSDIHLP